MMSTVRAGTPSGAGGTRTLSTPRVAEVSPRDACSRARETPSCHGAASVARGGLDRRVVEPRVRPVRVAGEVGLVDVRLPHGRHSLRLLERALLHATRLDVRLLCPRLHVQAVQPVCPCLEDDCVHPALVRARPVLHLRAGQPPRRPRGRLELGRLRRRLRELERRAAAWALVQSRGIGQPWVWRATRLCETRTGDVHPPHVPQLKRSAPRAAVGSRQIGESTLTSTAPRRRPRRARSRRQERVRLPRRQRVPRPDTRRAARRAPEKHLFPVGRLEQCTPRVWTRARGSCARARGAGRSRAAVRGTAQKSDPLDPVYTK